VSPAVPDFTIFIDADGCPRPVKELVWRASDRLRIAVVMVADRPLSGPRSPLVSTRIVPRGMDSADHFIVQNARTGDLVITADLPLAAEVVGLGATAMNPRGELYTAENVRERLSIRDFMMSLRDAGQVLGGPAPFSGKDKQRFAAALDRFLTGRLRKD
jgi:uncharacterized protein YaiI (UPF0178 family)